MKYFKEVITVFTFIIFLNISNLNASASKINYTNFDTFKQSVDINIVRENGLPETNSVELDFIRANQKQINLIRNEISFDSYNENNFLEVYSRLSENFTKISFDIYNESKFYLITNGVLTPTLDTTLRRISLNQINQFYGLQSISVSIPIENSKYLPVESAPVSAATAVPTVGLSTLAIATVFGVGTASGGGSGSAGGSCLGSCPSVSISASTSSIYDSDSSGFTLSINLDKSSTAPVIVSLQSTGTAILNSDFNGVTSVTVAAGSTSSTISYTPVADHVYEGTEIITIEVSSVTNGTENGTQSASVSLKEYALRLQTNFTDTGNSSTFAARDEFANVDAYTGTPRIHPFELLNIHKAHAFSDGTDPLSGKGITIHVADFNCDKQHSEFSGKTVHQYLTFSADSSNNYHCNLVAGIAAGDYQGTSGSIASGGGIMGVAYDADLVFTSIPDTPAGTWGSQHKANAIDFARSKGARVSNNSWGSWRDNCISISPWNCNDPNSGVNVTEMATRIAADTSKTVDEHMSSYLACGSVSSGCTSSWQAFIQAWDDFQTAGGIAVFATGNSTQESDVSAFAGLPEFYSQLSEAWLAVGYVDVTGAANNASITTSNVSQQGNVCGSAKEYCLITDAVNLNHAHWFDDNSGTSHFKAIGGGGSSSASPMVSGILALLMQAFPNHTAEQIVDRILASADNTWFTPQGNTVFTTHGNSIKHGYHNTWGHGFPDAYAALSPIVSDGNPRTSLYIDSGENLNSKNDMNHHSYLGSRLEVPYTFGESFVRALKGTEGYFYDALNGGFKFDFNSLFKNNYTEIGMDSILTNDILRLNKSSIFNHNKFDNIFSNIINPNSQNRVGSIKINLDSPSVPIQYFNKLTNNNNYELSRFDNPFTSNNKGGFGISSDILYNNKKILFGYHDSSLRTDLFGDAKVIEAKTLSMSINGTNKYLDNYSIMNGILIEDNSLLDMQGSGSLGLYEAKPTSFFSGLSLKKVIGKELLLGFNTTIGLTKVKDPNYGLIKSISDLYSSSFNFILEKNNIFNSSDSILFSLSQPNKIESGSIRIKIPGLANMNGELPNQVRDIDLSDTGRQLNFGIDYINEVNDNFKYGLKTIFTKDYANDSRSKIDRSITVTSKIIF